MQDEDQQKEAEADAATRRLETGLRTARSIVRDYRSELCRRLGTEPSPPRENPLFRFER